MNDSQCIFGWHTVVQRYKEDVERLKEKPITQCRRILQQKQSGHKAGKKNWESEKPQPQNRKNSTKAGGSDKEWNQGVHITGKSD